MIDMTASGEGQREDVDDRLIEVEVHDVSEGIASAPAEDARRLEDRQRGVARLLAGAQLRCWKQATVPMETVGIEPTSAGA
jgi:hypothetical protein